MDDKLFNDICTNLFHRCRNILDNKAKDYSDNDDRLASFYMISETSGEDVLSVWKIFFLKQLSAIFLSMKKQKETKSKVEVTEELDHRIVDCINYLVLLYAIVQDTEDQ